MSNRERIQDTAAQIKERLTAWEVVEFYGFRPDRSGFIQCPFHVGDDHGSLKVYDGDKGWHCFGCSAGGSVIDFVMRLFDIGFRQACVRLNADFNLNLVPGRQPSKAERSAALEARRREAERRAALDQEYREMAEEHLYCFEIVKYFPPMLTEDGAVWVHPFYPDAVKRLPTLEYWLDEHMSF